MFALFHIAVLSWLTPAEPVQRYDVIELRIEIQTRLHLEGDPPRLVRKATGTYTSLAAWNRDGQGQWRRRACWFLHPDGDCGDCFYLDGSSYCRHCSIEHQGDQLYFVRRFEDGRALYVSATRWVRQIVHADLDGDAAMKGWLSGRK